MSRVWIAAWLIAVAAVTNGGCSRLDVNRLYSRCEVPVEGLICPAVDLAEVVPQAERDNDTALWGCELWLRGSIESADDGGMDETLIDRNDWRIIARRDLEDPSSWECGDDVGQRIELDETVMASYRSASLVCPFDSHGGARCPDVVARDDALCETVGGEITVGVGTAVSSVVATTAGPAVVWYADSRGAGTPSIAWLSDDGESFDIPVTPCGTCDGTSALTESDLGHLPAQQATSSDDAVLVTGLCEQGQMLRVDPSGSCTALDLQADHAQQSLGLAVPEAAGEQSVVLWRSGVNLNVSAFDQSALTPEGQGRAIWVPGRGFQSRPNAACFLSGTDELCLITWQRRQEEGFDEVQWMLVSRESGVCSSGVVGRGSRPRLALFGTTPGGEQSGIVLWRDEDYGVLALPWGTTTSSTGVSVFFEEAVAQVGVGWVEETGAWTISEPTVLRLDDGTLLVGWWRAIDPDEGEEPFTDVELELRTVRLDAATQMLHVDRVLLDRPIRRTFTGGYDSYLPGDSQDETETRLELCPRPVLAWNVVPASAGQERGTLLAAWTLANDEEMAVNLITTTAATEELPAGTLSSPLSLVDQTEPTASEIDGAYSNDSGDATAVGDLFLTAFQTNSGLSVHSFDSTGQKLDSHRFAHETDIAAPGDVSLWSDPSSMGSSVYAAYSWLAGVAGEEGGSSTQYRLGAALLTLSGVGSIGTERDDEVIPDLDEATVQAFSPSFAAGTGPVLAWTSTSDTSVMSMGDTQNEESASVGLLLQSALSRVSPELGLEGWDTDGTLPLPLVSFSDDEPTVALGTQGQCPEALTTYFEVADPSACVFAVFGSLDGEALYASNGGYATSPTVGLTVAARTAADPSSWTPPASAELDMPWSFPTGLVVTNDQALIVTSALNPIDASQTGRVHAYVVDLASESVDVTELSTSWLAAVGAEFRSLRPVTMRLSAPADDHLMGAVWTRQEDDYDSGGDTQDDGPPPGDTGSSTMVGSAGIDVLFAEVDGTLRPRSRAVVIASWTGAPQNGASSMDPVQGDTTTQVKGVYDIVPAHFNSAVARLADGEYIVVWVEHALQSSTTEPDGDVTGNVLAQRIVCRGAGTR